MKKTRFLLIKWLSTILITSAIALELWQIYAGLVNTPIPHWLITMSWGGRMAIAIHLIEALVVSIYAPSRQKPSIRYGFYTFFVGTVGLVELFESSQSDGITE